MSVLDTARALMRRNNTVDKHTFAKWLRLQRISPRTQPFAAKETATGTMVKTTSNKSTTAMC